MGWPKESSMSYVFMIPFWFRVSRVMSCRFARDKLFRLALAAQPLFLSVSRLPAVAKIGGQ